MRWPIYNNWKESWVIDYFFTASQREGVVWCEFGLSAGRRTPAGVISTNLQCAHTEHINPFNFRTLTILTGDSTRSVWGSCFGAVFRPSATAEITCWFFNQPSRSSLFLFPRAGGAYFFHFVSALLVRVWFEYFICRPPGVDASFIARAGDAFGLFQIRRAAGAPREFLTQAQFRIISQELHGRLGWENREQSLISVGIFLRLRGAEMT